MGDSQVYAEVSDEEYERLEDVKDEHGLTWRGLLLQGAKSLENDGLL